MTDFDTLRIENKKLEYASYTIDIIDELIRKVNELDKRVLRLEKK